MRGMTWHLWLALIGLLAALGFAMYPTVAQWVNSRAQTLAILNANGKVLLGPVERIKNVWDDAQQYNETFVTVGDNSDYANQLNLLGDGSMGRIKIDKINVDLPVYHTSSDEVLQKGAGHMEQTTLPVGGKGRHAAITAHRGLAESVLFTNLDKVGVGDIFVVEVLGEPLAYRVDTVRIVKPEETEWLSIDSERDLVTLITCDPLGINTERILVTGERIIPTPTSFVEDVGKPPKVPGFPWWAIVGGGTMILIFVFVGYLAHQNYKADEKKEKQISG